MMDLDLNLIVQPIVNRIVVAYMGLQPHDRVFKVEFLNDGQQFK